MFVSNDDQICKQMARACGLTSKERPQCGTAARPMSGTGHPLSLGPSSSIQKPSVPKQQLSKGKPPKKTQACSDSSTKHNKHPPNRYHAETKKASHENHKDTHFRPASPGEFSFAENEKYSMGHDFKVYGNAFTSPDRKADRAGATGEDGGRERGKHKTNREPFVAPFQDTYVSQIFEGTNRNNHVTRGLADRRQHHHEQDEFIEGNMVDQGFQSTINEKLHDMMNKNDGTQERSKDQKNWRQDLEEAEKQWTRSKQTELKRLNKRGYRDEGEQWQSYSSNDSSITHTFQEPVLKVNNPDTDDNYSHGRGDELPHTKNKNNICQGKPYVDECDQSDDEKNYLLPLLLNRMQDSSKVNVDSVKEQREKDSLPLEENIELSTKQTRENQMSDDWTCFNDQKVVYGGHRKGLEPRQDPISAMSQSTYNKTCMVNQGQENQDHAYRDDYKEKHSVSIVKTQEPDLNEFPFASDVKDHQGASPKRQTARTNRRFAEEESDKPNMVSATQSCPICLEDITDPKRLDKCGHVFCKDCIDDSFKHHKPVCPSCNMVYGVLTGNQPDGNMDVGFSGDHLPGYEGHGTITITYYFPSGIQKSEHPNPRQPYKGTTRRAYLPDCPEGRVVLKLLKTAFDRKLTFTIGRSTTTGQENVVTWNDIHHKTNIDGGPTRFGYPDQAYLNRVKEELASKGVNE